MSAVSPSRQPLGSRRLGGSEPLVRSVSSRMGTFLDECGWAGTFLGQRLTRKLVWRRLGMVTTCVGCPSPCVHHSQKRVRGVTRGDLQPRCTCHCCRLGVACLIDISSVDPDRTENCLRIAGPKVISQSSSPASSAAVVCDLATRVHTCCQPTTYTDVHIDMSFILTATRAMWALRRWPRHWRQLQSCLRERAARQGHLRVECTRHGTRVTPVRDMSRT